MKDTYCIDLKNYEGVRTIFTEKQKVSKSDKHPDLRLDNFISRIKKAITNPSFVYRDLRKKDRCSYYYEEFKINSRTMYTKVMIKKQKRYCWVITAYRLDYVKERGKTKLLYGKDEN